MTYLMLKICLKVLADLEISCAQDEVASLLSILNSWKIRTVDDLRKRATAQVLEAIRSAYAIRFAGAKPTAFHLVSTLGILPPNASSAAARDGLAGVLQLLEVTLRTREGLSQTDASQ